MQDSSENVCFDSINNNISIDSNFIRRICVKVCVDELIVECIVHVVSFPGNNACMLIYRRGYMKFCMELNFVESIKKLSLVLKLFHPRKVVGRIYCIHAL